MAHKRKPKAPDIIEVSFNPLDKRNLGESVSAALLKRPIGPLPPTKRFIGAGVYAIYYVGDHPLYHLVAERNRENRFEQPIYVGKAVPPGARKGGFGLGDAPGRALWDRLRQHAGSIRLTADLKIDDFFCRYLASDDIWIPLGESLLIENFQPLWNVLIAGFGIHAPGKGRKKQVRSYWDTLHAGRRFAKKLPANPKTRGQLEQLIADYYAGRPVQLISPEQAATEDGATGEENS